MQVKILEYTKNPLKIIHTAARTCYSELTPSHLHVSKGDEKLVHSVIKMGHHSILEHVAITFAIEKISRACSHQLVRHRIASYSQQSQRYVKYDKIDYIVPPSMKDMTPGFDNFMKDIKHHYEVLIEEGVAPEDARYIFPNAVATNITMTVNARELIEMCKLRLCTTAQWEIRKMFEMIVAHIRSNKQLKFLSEYLTPKCEWIKYCPEGKRTCGRVQTPENGD